jgi:hypothetical protein
MKAIFIVGILLASQFAQAKSSSEAFQLGWTSHQVYIHMGLPRSYYCARNGLHYTRPFCPGGHAAESYPRIVHGHEYEFFPNFDIDESFSRLHPGLRLSEISAESDKALPVRTMLSEIAEIKLICQAGCTVRVVGRGKDDASIELIQADGTGKRVQISFERRSIIDYHAEPLTSLDGLATGFSISEFKPDPEMDGWRGVEEIGQWPESQSQK